MIKQEEMEQLIGRCRKKDSSAFAMLVSAFQPLVFRVAFRLLCDEDEAKDVVQDTFIKVWLSLDKYRKEYRFSTWIYKITCNLCYDRLRTMRHVFPAEGEEFVSIPVTGDDVETSVANRQLRELILRYTQDLPPRQRMVFTLRDVEELEVGEVEAITGLPPEKIKSILYLARKNIRNRINQLSPER